MGERIEIRAPVEETEGTRSQLLQWLKPAGARVQRDEPLLELETDKATVEIPAPADGVLREILKRERDEVAPGELLGFLERESSTERMPASGASGAAGEPDGERARADTVTRAHEVAAAPQAAASPAVRRLLSELGLRADELEGTGAGGRLTVDDVLRAASARAGDPGAPAASASAASAASAATADAPLPGVRRVPHSAIRRRIADHMLQSMRTAPHVTSVFEADLSAVLAHREAHREAFARQGAPLTLSVYFLAAAVAAIRAVPEANSRWTEEALEIHEAINIGVATALGADGLVVPVIRGVEQLDIEQIASALHGLVERARSGELTPADMRGGTFTLSNHGVSGSLLAAPIVINQPQSAILGVGRIERRAAVVGSGAEERITVRPKCYVTLTIDHRVLDGYQANRFLQVLVERLEGWPA